MESGTACCRHSFGAFVVATICAVPAAADDWPALRGPHYTGVSSETDLADHWPQAGPPVLWSRDLGQGYSSFAVVAGRAYTQYQSVFGQFVICVDARTGETVWEHRYDLPYEAMGIYPGPRGTPTIVGERLYFTSPDGVAGCLRTGDGSEVWSVNVNDQFGGRGTEFGYSCSPLVMDGRVILPVGGESAAMVALDAGTGDTLWTSGNDSASYCTALAITLGGRTLIVGYLQNVLALYDPATGRAVWRTSVSSGYDEHSAAPLYHEPLLLVSAPFRAGADVYKLAWDDSTDPPVVKGTPHWHSDEFSNDVVSSLVLDGAIYGFDLRDPQSKAHRPSRGTFRCLDFETGNVLWSSDRIGQASLMAVDSKVLLFSDAGDVILSRMSREGYEELGRVTIFGDEVCWTPPALSEGRLYLRTQSRAVCLYVGRPEDLTPEESTRSIMVSEIARDAGTRWGWLLNGEREHPFMRPDVDELVRWFAACFVASALPLLSLLGVPPTSSRRLTRIVLVLCGMFVLGVVATPVVNEWQDAFLFTWPVALYAALQLTLVTIEWAERQEDHRRARRRSRLAGVLFLLVCAGYFAVLRAESLPHEWIFLFGLLPAFPFAAYTARRLVRPSGRWATAVCPLATFAIYFWSCGAALWVRSLWTT